MTLADTLRSARFEVRMRIATNPNSGLLYRPVIWWGQHKIRRANDGHQPRERLVLPDTELVIDGFQGSANTYFTRAFQYAQDRPVRLAHHLHAAVAVLKGVELGRPVLVTLREPAGAALSLVSRWPYVTVAQALRQYTRYYEAVEPALGAYVLSPFAATVGRPDLVIEAVNARFGTAFTPFPMTEADIEAVRPMTPKRKANLAERALVKERKRPELDRPEAQRWLGRARAVYDRLLPHAPPALAALED